MFVVDVRASGSAATKAEALALADSMTKAIGAILPMASVTTDSIWDEDSGDELDEFRGND